jgi:hypothetical protein
MSAPLRSSFVMTYSSRSTSSSSVMREVWILKMPRRVLGPGIGNSTATTHELIGRQRKGTYSSDLSDRVESAPGPATRSCWWP